MRKWVICCAVAFVVGVLMVCIGLRIQTVNANATIIPEETRTVGETVELDGAFMTTVEEGTDGYCITVNGAEKMSYNEYVERYGTAKAKRKLAKGETVSGADEKSVVVIDITITNTNKKEGGYLAGGEWRLVPERANTYYILGTTLFGKSEKNAPDEIGSFSLLPDSSYTMHMPFVTNTAEEEIYEHAIEDTKFKLHVADAPVSKTISIEAE